MRTAAAALLAALASCAGQPETQPPQDAVAARVPAALRWCPVAPGPTTKPPQPRTFDRVVDYAARAEESRTATARALEVCRSKLTRVIELYEQGTER